MPPYRDPPPPRPKTLEEEMQEIRRALVDGERALERIRVHAQATCVLLVMLFAFTVFMVHLSEAVLLDRFRTPAPTQQVPAEAPP